jgi:hypothetical protein
MYVGQACFFLVGNRRARDAFFLSSLAKNEMAASSAVPGGPLVENDDDQAQGKNADSAMRVAVRACFLNDKDFQEIAEPWLPRMTDVWQTVRGKTTPSVLTIDDPSLRLGYFLVCAAASLVRGLPEKRVVFLCPTAHYLAQAQRFGGALMHEGDKAGSSPRLRFQLAVTFDAWAENDVVCMHGKLFFSPPAGWAGACIVQDMSHEDVPWTRPFASRCCYDD